MLKILQEIIYDYNKFNPPPKKKKKNTTNILSVMHTFAFASKKNNLTNIYFCFQMHM